MPPNEEPVLFQVDFRGPSPAGDCLDCLAAFPEAIDRMRAAKDDSDIPESIALGTEAAFKRLDNSRTPEDDGLFVVAAVAQDQLYRHIVELTVMDRYTRSYCDLAIRYFFTQLSERRIRTFYILDNTLPNDRFAAILELFRRAGIATVTPKRDGTAWPTLSALIRTALKTLGHVAYIEPDAEINHVEAATRLARELTCVATLRNLGPEDQHFEILKLRAS